MKKLTLLAALVSLSAISQAQTSALLKFKYLPKHTYFITKRLGMSMEMTPLTDSTGASLPLNPDGNKQSLSWKVSTESGQSIKTTDVSSQGLAAAVTCNNSFMTMSVNGAMAPASPDDPLIGQAINGTIDTAGKLVIDTITNTTLTTMAKSSMGSMMDRVPLKIAFPDKPMKVGDTFTRETKVFNLDLSNFGVKQDYPSQVTYKLTAIKDDMAYFDTAEDFKLDVVKEIKGHKATTTGRGSGLGKVVYNIAKGYPISIISDLTIAFDIQADADKFIVKYTTNVDEQYTVKAN